MDSVLKVATPLTAAIVVVPLRVPAGLPALLPFATVTFDVSKVTRLLYLSSTSTLTPPARVMVEPPGVRELLASVSGPGLTTLGLKVIMNGPLPVTVTLPVPTLVKATNPDWMLAASVAGVLLQVIALVVWVLNVSLKV